MGTTILQRAYQRVRYEPIKQQQTHHRLYRLRRDWAGSECTDLAYAMVKREGIRLPNCRWPIYSYVPTILLIQMQSAPPVCNNFFTNAQFKANRFSIR